MLKGKNALVTGSTRGIGLATARALAAQGCNIVLNGFGDQNEIETHRRTIENDYGVTALFHGADLSADDQLDDLADVALSKLGGIDILVNNAVIRYFHPIEEFDRDEWRHALAVNLSAPFFLTQRVLPGMRQRGWGRIVNLSSVMGFGGRSGRVDYISCKTGILGLTRATAAETRREKNITCNAVCPGSVLTPNTEIKIQELADAKGLNFEDAKEAYVQNRGQTSGFIDPSEIADTIVYLCQDGSYNISGAAIPVDRGRSVTWLEGPLD